LNIHGNALWTFAMIIKTANAHMPMLNKCNRPVLAQR
jgi:hypothetical protein